MTRLHADPVEVQRCDTGLGPEPAEFVWRGRRYVVREVLARWTEAGGWWEGGVVQALTRGDTAPDALGAAPPDPLEGSLDTVPIPSSPKWAQRAPLTDRTGEPAPDVGASVGPAGVDDRERDWWRVEAGAGRATGPRRSDQWGVYDLCFDWSRGSWSLARVLD